MVLMEMEVRVVENFNFSNPLSKDTNLYLFLKMSQVITLILCLIFVLKLPSLEHPLEVCWNIYFTLLIMRFKCHILKFFFLIIH